MAKSSEWFSEIFAQASKKTEHEYGRVQESVRKAIQGGETNSEYIRNQFGYNSELPHPSGKTKKEFFNSVYGAVVREIRENVMFSAMNSAWGVALKGISGLKTYLVKYTEMTERGTNEIKVMVSNKADKKTLKAKGILPTKGNSFLLRDIDLIELIGGKIGFDLLHEEEVEVEENGVKKTISEPSLDMKFADEYVRKLTKLLPCRESRMSSFGVEDEFDYDSL